MSKAVARRRKTFQVKYKATSLNYKQQTKANFSFFTPLLFANAVNAFLWFAAFSLALQCVDH